MKKIFPFLSLFFFFAFLPNTFSIGYGGIGGEPANPRSDNPRSESIFIHTLGPGSVVSEGVRVINNTDEKKDIRIYSVDSEIASGGKFACRQLSAEKTDVGKWISLKDSIVSLEPKTNTVVPFQINVPESVSPGEHNGCVVIEEVENTGSKSSGINLHFRTGIRAAITIPGEIKQEVVLIGLSIDKRKKTADKQSTILVQPHLMNVGNVSVDTRVFVSVKSFWGHLINEQNSLFTVPSGEQTDWNFEIPAPFWGGWYKVDHSVGYQKQFFPNRAIAENLDDSSSSLKASLFDDNTEEDLTADEDVHISGKSQWFFVGPTLPALIIESAAISFLVLVFFLWRISVRRKRWIQETWTEYTVRVRDDIKTLAKKHDISWKIIVNVNDLEPPYTLEKGQKILLPPADDES